MLWNAFRSAPSAALAVLVCLPTILWCFWLLRRAISQNRPKSKRSLPIVPVAYPPLPQQYATPIEQLTPVLTDPAFKLYFYLCTRSEACTGWVMVDESALAALRKDFEEVASLLKELEQQGMCQLTNDDSARPITVQLLSPRLENGPAAAQATTDSLLALGRAVGSAGTQIVAAPKPAEQHELWPL